VLKGRKGEKVSAYTVRKHCRNIQTCLHLAGPKTHKFRKAQGLIEEVPYLEKPTVDDAPPEDIFTLAEVGAILDNCHRMTFPAWPGLSPQLYWWGLATLTYNTAERIGAMLGVEFAGLNAAGDQLKFPRGVRKGKVRSHVVPLNLAARECIAAIRGERERKLMFPWPKGRRQIYDYWYKLLTYAGIPLERQFGFHAIRKAANTEMASNSGNPMASQMLLNHQDLRTTMKHYTGAKVLREALDKLPQPPTALGEREQQIRKSQQRWFEAGSPPLLFADMFDG
jgi:integrase